MKLLIALIVLATALLAAWAKVTSPKARTRAEHERLTAEINKLKAQRYELQKEQTNNLAEFVKCQDTEKRKGLLALDGVLDARINELSNDIATRTARLRVCDTELR